MSTVQVEYVGGPRDGVRAPIVADCLTRRPPEFQLDGVEQHAYFRAPAPTPDGPAWLMIWRRYR